MKHDKIKLHNLFTIFYISSPAADQGDFITMNEDHVIVRRDIADPYTDAEVIVDASGLYDLYESINGWWLSADAKFAFFRYNYTKVRI